MTSRMLTDMDAELAVLEQRQAKTRALQQGMMQELLTGRTRLVDGVVSEFPERGIHAASRSGIEGAEAG